MRWSQSHALSKPRRSKSCQRSTVLSHVMFWSVQMPKRNRRAILRPSFQLRIVCRTRILSGMGRTTLKMPQLGESVTEGTVDRWLKQEGDMVRRDEPIVEVVTDKV